MAFMHMDAIPAAAAALDADAIPASVSSTANEPDNALASYRLNPNGETETASGSTGATLSYSSIGSWLLSGNADEFEARMTMTSGTPFSSGTLGSWVSLSGFAVWVQEDDTAGECLLGDDVTGTATLEIRIAATGEILDSASVTLTACKQSLN